MPPDENPSATPASPTPTPSPAAVASPPTATSSPSSATPPKTGGPVSGETANEPDQVHDFSSLGEDLSDIGEIVAEAKKETKPAAEPPAPAPTSAEPLKVEAPKTPEPPKAPETPAPEAEAAKPAEQVRPEGPATVDDVLNAMQKDHEKVMAQVLPKFQLSPDQIKALEDNATEEVPKLLASTYMRAVNTSLRYMQEFMPRMIENQLMQQNTIKQTNDSFFSQWKSVDPNNKEHISAIKHFAAAFRSINPKITQEELFNLVGTSVTSKFKLGLAAADVPKPAAPSAVPGFVPAGPGVVVKTAPIDDGAYAALGQDLG